MSNFYFHRGGLISPPKAQPPPRKALLESNWLLVAALLAAAAIGYLALGGQIPRIDLTASLTSGKVATETLVR